MKIPNSKFNVGDPVSVRREEAGTPDSFPAIVIGVEWENRLSHLNRHLYTVVETDHPGTAGVDGYTEDWLSPRTIAQPTVEASTDEAVKAAFAFLEDSETAPQRRLLDTFAEQGDRSYMEASVRILAAHARARESETARLREALAYVIEWSEGSETLGTMLDMVSKALTGEAGA